MLSRLAKRVTPTTGVPLEDIRLRTRRRSSGGEQYAKVADAGYSALLSYAGQEKVAQGEALAALQRTSVDSALRFAKAFPKDGRNGSAGFDFETDGVSAETAGSVATWRIRFNSLTGMNNPLASFGSNHVLFGGISKPASLTAMSCSTPALPRSN